MSRYSVKFKPQCRAKFYVAKFYLVRKFYTAQELCVFMAFALKADLRYVCAAHD